MMGKKIPFNEWHKESLDKEGMKEVYLNDLGGNIKIPKDVQHTDIFYKNPSWYIEIPIWKWHVLIHIHKGSRC